MTGFMVAIRFLTAFPLGKGRTVEPREMAASMAFFPLVGVWLGAMLLLLDMLFAKALPVQVTSVLLIGFLAIVTGGLHLDGFADTLDGLFGGRGDKARVLEIMKDSRIGAMGVVGLSLLLLMKFACINGLPAGTRWQALILMPTLARWSQVVVATGSDYARKGGSLAQAFVEFLEWKHFAVATLFAAAAALFLSGMAGFVALAAAGTFALGAKYFFARKIGGVTGDTIGAVSEVNELIVLIAFLLTG